MNNVSYAELKRVEQLARTAHQIDANDGGAAASSQVNQSLRVRYAILAVVALVTVSLVYGMSIH